VTNRVVLSEGIRGGVVLALAAVVLAVLGLTPSLSWIPEVPLMVVAVLVPIVVLGITGFRAGSRWSRLEAGGMAGAVAGGIGGLVGGLSYVVFGKSLLNIAVGLILGAIGGAIVGATGGLLARRYTLT
jgi:hypothetical protein